MANKYKQVCMKEISFIISSFLIHVLSSPISYNIRSVCETLHWLLTEALKYYPQTIPWLKMKGDLELGNFLGNKN